MCCTVNQSVNHVPQAECTWGPTMDSSCRASRFPTTTSRSSFSLVSSATTRPDCERGLRYSVYRCSSVRVSESRVTGRSSSRCEKRERRIGGVPPPSSAPPWSLWLRDTGFGGAVAAEAAAEAEVEAGVEAAAGEVGCDTVAALLLLLPLLLLTARSSWSIWLVRVSWSAWPRGSAASWRDRRSRRSARESGGCCCCCCWSMALTWRGDASPPAVWGHGAEPSSGSGAPVGGCVLAIGRV